MEEEEQDDDGGGRATARLKLVAPIECAPEEVANSNQKEG